jgi:aminopeptidase
MLFDFPTRLDAFAEVIVRVGLNLQPGQRLLIAEPYELQGVSRSAEIIVDAVKTSAAKRGLAKPEMIEVIWGDPVRLREFAAKEDWKGLARLVAANADKINDSVDAGDAVLFLLGSQPGLMEGIAPRRVAETRRIGNEYFGPVAQQLTQGATNWTAAPAPSAEWAHEIYADLSPTQRLPALWDAVFEATRIPKYKAGADALVAWNDHLRLLEKRRDELNVRRYKSLSYQGEGTDLTVSLPSEHLWCTASMRTESGVHFVANLPTEEVFTLPHRDSAEGIVRITRPVVFGGALIDGINLEFKNGRVVNATARTGEMLLHRLLGADPGANRLGEVAIVGENLSSTLSSPEALSPPWSRNRLFRHVLLDENAGSHIALGEGYGFCLKSPNREALNRSLIHVDLSITATANLRR